MDGESSTVMTRQQVTSECLKFFRDMFTGVDNYTYDLGRVLWAAGVIWFLWVSTWSVMVDHKDFDMVDAGTGLGLVLAGGGAALWAKKSTEHNKDSTDDNKG
jgi:drug/metabolite transporter superfamily protein YnfA